MPNNGAESALPRKDWRTLAELASRETDSAKLVEIVHELCDVLEQAEREKSSGHAAYKNFCLQYRRLLKIVL